MDVAVSAASTPVETDEDKRFLLKLRYEQERKLALKRMLRLRHTRVSDATEVYIAQRALLDKQAAWAAEKAELQAKLVFLQGKHDAYCSLASGTESISAEVRETMFWVLRHYCQRGYVF
jgi:hypothetical protein